MELTVSACASVAGVYHIGSLACAINVSLTPLLRVAISSS
jgi:hypothetical protein